MTFPKRKFGVEIEYVGVERDVIINALANIGVKCVSEYYNHNTKRHWKIVLPAKKDLKLFNEIPEEVAFYYKNLVKKKDKKNKVNAQKKCA